MSQATCSWCGSHGPFPSITAHLVTVPSCYCTVCATHVRLLGVYPPRTAAQREAAGAARRRLVAARGMGR